MKKISELKKKWRILFKILPCLLLVLFLKFVFHQYGFEAIALSALFTSIIAATTFLIGFLITGVISDYKESEKIPGELASSWEAIYDKAYIINKNKESEVTKEFLKFHKDTLQSIHDWFYEKERTKNLMAKLSKMNDYYAQFESMTQATYINRMKQEQTNIRKQITRAHMVRETSFVQSAYAIVEALAFLLITGLLILRYEPFYESLFFSFIVSFLVLYMLFLIKDLDNPFEYDKYCETGNEISLKALHDVMARVELKNKDAG